MYPTPSNSSSSSIPSSSSSSVNLVQPSTPQIRYVGLPPSPLSPHGTLPNTRIQYAPYLGTVSLPPTAPATTLHAPYGLMTPPQSPGAKLSSNNIHPLLAYNPCPALNFNINRHPSEAHLPSYYTAAVFREQGFQNPVNGFLVNVVGTDWHFPITQRTPLMVSDILEQVYTWACVVCSQSERAALSVHVQNAAFEYFRTCGSSGAGLRRFHVLGTHLRFAGFSRGADGSSWNLHLSE